MKVKMTQDGSTSDIGDFKEGQIIILDDVLAREAIRQNLAESISKPTKKKSEVKADGGE